MRTRIHSTEHISTDDPDIRVYTHWQPEDQRCGERPTLHTVVTFDTDYGDAQVTVSTSTPAVLRKLARFYTDAATDLESAIVREASGALPLDAA